MIKVIPLKFYDNGYMAESFAFGGTRAKEDCKDVKYPASLQNYLIDDGKDVILSDTGFPEEEKDYSHDDGSMPLYMGKKVATFKEAFEASGYKVEDVTKILITHKHPDHTGELRMFPNAKIYISEREADDMNLTGDNVVRVKFTDGAYKNFPDSQRITDSLVMIKAVGHTEGTSIYILEDKDNDLYYMFHGDVTYCDAALIANELSVADENKTQARITSDRIREFIKNNKTIYCSTHCPQGYQAVENKTPMVLEDSVNDNSVIHNIGYGLYVLTARDGEKDNGCIINTAVQVTSNPQRLAVCVNKMNKTNEMIKKSKKFNLSILTEETKFDLIKHFGFQSGNDINKFENFKSAKRAENGILYVSEYTNSYISATVEQEIEFETHTMFIALVDDMQKRNTLSGVTYDYYYKNIKPKAQKTDKKGWRCKTCGYVYEGEVLPDDYICPICKHGVEDFERV